MDVDETLNPRLGGYMSMMHDADSFVPPLRVLPVPVPTVVGSIRVAPVAASIPVAELSGIAVSRKSRSNCLSKKCKETTIHRKKPVLGFLQEGLVQVCVDRKSVV